MQESNDFGFLSVHSSDDVDETLYFMRTVFYAIFSSTEEIAHTPRDEVLVDIDDKEPLIPGQVWSVFLSAT